MTREGTESEERKDWAQMPIDTRNRTLYPEWETVGDPWKDGDRELVYIRKRLPR